MKVLTLKTPVLHQAYEISGPKKGEPLILLHGWPDSPRAWDQVLPALHEAGYRTLVPYLRGFGPSRFRNPLLGRKPRRTGQPVAFAQDMIALADHFGLKRFHFIGHDWGARTAYTLAALFPQRLKSIVTMAVPFEPGKATPPELTQARAIWYQWFFCTKPGEQKFRADPVAYGRKQWETWSPPGWFTEAAFKDASASWTGPDYQDVVLHAYRSRWGHAELDPAYAALQKREEATRKLTVPTLLIQGREDHCELAATTDGAERHFTAPYHRVLLDGVGHFPQREDPGIVAALILEHLKQSSRADQNR